MTVCDTREELEGREGPDVNCFVGGGGCEDGVRGGRVGVGLPGSCAVAGGVWEGAEEG